MSQIYYVKNENANSEGNENFFEQGLKQNLNQKDLFLF